MAYQYWSYETLQNLCMEVYQKFGFSARDSEVITDVILASDLYGIESHGVQRMQLYSNGIRKGTIKVDAQAEVVFETPVSAVIDGHGCMGQLAGHKAMELAIAKAKTSGIGMVSVRNSNHYGIAGYYAKMASSQGLIGLSCTNSSAIMVPTYGRIAMLGSNPLAMAMPAEPCDFFFDASTSVVTRGKVEVYNKQSKPLPLGWALDKEGRPTSDADDVLRNIAQANGGGIVPLGGDTEQFGSHKGYGYGMIVEILSAVLSLGDTSNLCGMGKKGRVCHAFIAIDPAIFGDPAAIKSHLSNYLRQLRESPKAEGAERIYTHGEKEQEAVAVRMKEGIPVLDNTMVEILDICRHLDVDFSKYFGDYLPPDTGFKGNVIH